MSDNDARKRRTADLRASNEKREKTLAASGTPFPNVVPIIQSQALHKLVIGDDPERQIDFDLAFQEVLAEMLDSFEPKAREAQLMGGVSGAVLRHPASQLHAVESNGK